MSACERAPRVPPPALAAAPRSPLRRPAAHRPAALRPAGESAQKRARRGAAAAAADTPVIRPSLLADAGARAALAAAYTVSAPFPHALVPDLVDPALLRAARDEIIDNVSATYKETDLFKMLQTGDLANLDRLDAAAAARLPALLRLRDALYSPEFRAFIEQVTGCGALSERTDCACNVHAPGGHLLCHDDVIGARRVSFILYLTDPDAPWRAEDGGALELYPLAAGGAAAPAPAPAATVLPTWNALAFFGVEPGRSFHAIQEVAPGAPSPRMAIQGWFHAPAPPPGAELATLRQLQARGGDAAADYEPFSPVEQGGGADPGPEAELTPADLALLKEWVNPAYLEESAAAKVRARFEAEGSVQLRAFLRADRAAAVAAATAAADADARLGGGRLPAHGDGAGGGWAPVGPAHMQRYMRWEGSVEKSTGTADAGATTAADTPGAAEAAAAGRLLAAVASNLFASAAFARLVRRLTTLAFLGRRAEVRRFRPGLDYTVAHFGCLTPDPRLDCVLSFVDEREESGGADAWAGGEVGGFEAYLLADEEEAAAGAAAEVYRGPGEGGGDDAGVLNVAPAANTLSLVLRDEGLMRFVKYVSAAAPGSRWDVAAVLLPEDDGESEEEEEEAAE
jgi:Rps23 Pro-64 3,4-dihydroxylase Tpa1-like proline 4-hydroxylase